MSDLNSMLSIYMLYLWSASTPTDWAVSLKLWWVDEIGKKLHGGTPDSAKHCLAEGVSIADLEGQGQSIFICKKMEMKSQAINLLDEE